MRDRSDRYQIQNVHSLASAKQIGSYLVDAGLLTTDQINVVLNDQQATGMRFGEIAVARGWVKEQTIEWIMSKVVEPERRAQKRQEQVARWANSQPAASPAKATVPLNKPPLQGVPTVANSKSAVADKANAQKSFVRREVPISKPLPSVGSSDGDVNWVG